MTTNTNFFVLTSAFSVMRVTTAPVADAIYEMVVRQDALSAFGSAQLVAIAKSMNSDLKVNSKQSKEIILAAIEEELKTFPIEVITASVKRESTGTGRIGGTKQICFEAFGTIDMADKAVARELIDKLVVEHNLDKRVVQSYASNYRKALNGE